MSIYCLQIQHLTRIVCKQGVGIHGAKGAYLLISQVL